MGWDVILFWFLLAMTCLAVLTLLPDERRADFTFPDAVLFVLLVSVFLVIWQPYLKGVFR